MSSIKVFALVVLSSFFLVKNSHSQNDKIYNFLYLNPDARSSALAGSFIAMYNDVNSIFYNPAALPTLEKRQLSIGFFKYLLDINSGNAAYSQKYKDIGWFGAGIQYMNYGSFKKFDDQFNEVGTFGANELALTLAYATDFAPNFFYGVNAKLIYSSIDEYTSTAVAADLGLLYFDPVNSFSLGISLQNLGTQISKYSSAREDLPLNLSLGASKQLEYLPLTVFAGVSDLLTDEDKFIDRFKNLSVGGEFELSENVYLRLGYDNRFRHNYKTGTSTGLAGFSAGLGIDFQDRYGFDYSFNSLGNVGATHRINLNYNFD